MQVFHGLEELQGSIQGSVVALGNFDGCHVGHQALASQLVTASHLEGVPSVVLTFYPHPVEVLNPGKLLKRIMTTDEKLEALERLGVEVVLVEPFTKALSELSPTAFFERYLLNGVKAKRIHVGFNFCFGKNRKGDTNALQKLCDANQMQLQVVSPVEKGQQRISSSLIRALIEEGEVRKAAEFLGRPYKISGIVVRGEQRGRTLGFPTANIQFPKEKIFPKNGVYLSQAVWQQQTFQSVTNIGVRPTFENEAPVPNIETYLLDFGASIYDETLSIELLDFIREEKSFSGPDALRQQIEKDVTVARARFDALTKDGK